MQWHACISRLLLLLLLAGGPLWHAAHAQVILGAGVFVPFIQAPSVGVIQGGQSQWDWAITPPDGPVKPNPLRLNEPGSLTYQVDVYKNANGKTPAGTFSITAQVVMQSYGPVVQIDNVYVMLTGPGINQRINPSGCTPGNRKIRPGTVLVCNINLPRVTLQGQANGRNVAFTGFRLQPYANFVVDRKSTTADGVARAGQLVGPPADLPIPTSTNDCAILTQIFDGAEKLPELVTTTAGPQLFSIANPVAFNPTPVCQSQTWIWRATFRFNAADCRGSNSPTYPRQIKSNFKLEPAAVAGGSRQQPLVFDVMTNVAYIACNNKGGGTTAALTSRNPAILSSTNRLGRRRLLGPQ
jgi:hypothetical protein